jgi:hypothetical protein
MVYSVVVSPNVSLNHTRRNTWWREIPSTHKSHMGRWPLILEANLFRSFSLVILAAFSIACTSKQESCYEYDDMETGVCIENNGTGGEVVIIPTTNWIEPNGDIMVVEIPETPTLAHVLENGDIHVDDREKMIHCVTQGDALKDINVFGNWSIQLSQVQIKNAEEQDAYCIFSDSNN